MLMRSTSYSGIVLRMRFLARANVMVGARVSRARPTPRTRSDYRTSRAGGGPPGTSAPTTGQPRSRRGFGDERDFTSEHSDVKSRAGPVRTSRAEGHEFRHLRMALAQFRQGVGPGEAVAAPAHGRAGTAVGGGGHVRREGLPAHDEVHRLRRVAEVGQAAYGLLKCPHGHAHQFSMRRPAKRLKWRVLPVANVAPYTMAVAAISVSAFTQHHCRKGKASRPFLKPPHNLLVSAQGVNHDVRVKQGQRAPPVPSSAPPRSRL